MNKTINYDFRLPSNTWKRHLETRAANVWDLVQSDQSPFHACLCCFFLSERSSYEIRTSVRSNTNNRLFNLEEGLLQTHSYIFSHSINLRGLPLSSTTVTLHYLPWCMRSTVRCGQTPTTVTCSELFQICCRVIDAP